MELCLVEKTNLIVFFRSRSGVGNDQRFMKLAKLHGLSHLIKKN